MKVLDWRHVPGRVMQALYAREQGYWRTALDWDASHSWDTIERARTTWGLPGFVAADPGGSILGWTFYLPHGGACEAGGLTADTPAATAALLDSLVAAARSGKSRLSLFAAVRAAALPELLAARGFDVTPHQYLWRPFSAWQESGALAPPPARGWTAADLEPAAALLAAAYGPAGAHFAPHNRPDEWRRYVSGLVEQTACGRLMPEASRVLMEEGRMTALVIATRIAERTAHLAQVAVAPELRRRGLAAALVEDACRRTAAAGCTAATLLVADTNTPARRLYGRLGFSARSTFVAATRTP